MPQVPLRPHMVMADAQGNIYDHPDLLMLCRRGREWGLPRPDELMPLPPESELFLLPGRNAVGFNPENGDSEVQETLAVAAFAAPAHTVTAHPVWERQPQAPMLPLFAYGAVGFARGRFYICAAKVDDDHRQEFRTVSKKSLQKAVRDVLDAYQDNRLMQHIMRNCVLRYDCPAARNLALGRYEAPLPTSRVCNARCVGCISQQEPDSPIAATPQCRLDFTPTAREVTEIMFHHAQRETQCPVYSFGQGCEGEPLTQAPLLIESIQEFRRRGGKGTVNLNSNASRPDAVQALAEAGLSSLRVSMNSARPEVYTRYYRPQGYTFDDVRDSLCRARRGGVFTSLNLLYFPGATDTEDELASLIELVGSCGVSFIQLRNLNIDPDFYLQQLDGLHMGPAVGFKNFRKRLRKACPWVKFGYFNPYIGDKAQLTAPLPGEWRPLNAVALLHLQPEENNTMTEKKTQQPDDMFDDDDFLDDDTMAEADEEDGPPDDICGCEDEVGPDEKE